MRRLPNPRYLLLALLASALLVTPGSEGWSGLVAEGHRLASQHRLLSAAERYQRLSQFPGGSTMAAGLLGDVYLKRGQWREAAEQFRLVAETPTPSRESLLGLARAMERQGDSQSSLRYLRRELELRPRDGEAWAGLVEQAARKGMRPAEIGEFLGDSPTPTSDRSHGQRVAYLLAACLREPGSVEGRAALQKAVSGPDRQVAEDAEEMMRLLAAAAAGEGKATDLPSSFLARGLVGPAMELLEGPWGEGGPAAEVLALKGYGLMRTGRPEEAEGYLRRAHALDPENSLVEYLLGSYLRTLGEGEQAARLLYSATRHDPGNPAIYAELANALIELGDYGTGEQALGLAVQAAPEDPELRMAVAEFYSGRQFRLDEALGQAQEAVRLSNRSPEALGALGWALHLMGRSEEGLPPLEEAVGKAPESPLLRYRLGSVYEGMKLGDRAREQYLMVAELDGSGEHCKRAQAALDDMQLLMTEEES